MIGVAANPDEWDTAREFFELFKTPWEPAVEGRTYRAVVSTVGQPAGVAAGILIAYGAAESVIDHAAGVKAERDPTPRQAEWAGEPLPLYRGAAEFKNGGPSTLRSDRRALDYRASFNGKALWRVGYNLFDEVSHLLTVGQPPEHALSPALDLHISLLREFLTQSGVSFVEVKPRPSGHDFVCCLTHDIDFYGIRRHGLDKTMAGFVARASVGSIMGLLRGRRTLAEALRNWAALLSLPLVFLRVLPDFWRPIEDYECADGARPSTFFVVPFRDSAGAAADGGPAPTRAVKYQASEVGEPLAAAAARGRELGVHGIDVWRDAEAGRAEMAQVAPLAGRNTAGVRMHWLYWSSESAACVEAAGFDYDSTCGYNDAIGYRAGTSQAFRLPGTARLMELPIAIMDTALFYPDRMNLARQEALDRCRGIVAHARRAGGTVVVNWHDRSLAPERLWGRAYEALLDELDRGGAWFATARDAVDWFRWRRSVTFACEPDGAVAIQAGPSRQGLPGAVVTVQQPVRGAHDDVTLEAGGMVTVNL